MVKSPIQQAEETKFSDHTVIVPPHRLKSVITHTTEQGDFAMDVVARAEAALSEIRHEFRSWMNAECEALEAARNEMRSQGPSTEALQKVSHAAHEIKGHAAVLGFPLAGRIAAILCRLLAYSPNPQLVPLAVIDSHVDAIRAVVREQIHTINDKPARKSSSAWRSSSKVFSRKSWARLTPILPAMRRSPRCRQSGPTGNSGL
jgi:hypothetical protein